MVVKKSKTKPAVTSKAKTKPTFLSFQEIIFKLQKFWSDQGCVILQPYDTEVGAGTFHPATTLRSLGPETWKAAYVQPSRRPTDGRYGENPNRLQHYYQFQVVIKPSPEDVQKLYLKSLTAIGIGRRHRIRASPGQSVGPRREARPGVQDQDGDTHHGRQLQDRGSAPAQVDAEELAVRGWDAGARVGGAGGGASTSGELHGEL